MTKIIVERQELKGDTAYDTLVGMYDTVEEANAEIEQLLIHLTEKEKASCSITAFRYELNEDGDIDYDKGGYNVEGAITHN